jgi:hypothetical protein
MSIWGKLSLYISDFFYSERMERHLVVVGATKIEILNM